MPLRSSTSGRYEPGDRGRFRHPQPTQGDTTMVRVETSTQINRPVEEVFAYIDDPAKMPEWIDILAQSVPSESPTQVGTRIANRVNLLGRSFRNTLEVVEHVPNKKVVSKADKPFPITLTYLLTPANGGATGFTTILEAEPTA